MREKTLFVVTSDILLRQTLEAIKSFLPDLNVTAIGDGEWNDEGDVVVATVQTLAARTDARAFEKICNGFGMMFADEMHHMKGGVGDAWREVGLAVGARRKFGLSATVNLESDEEGRATDSVWLRGICGPILYEVEMDDLIERGFLLRPTVNFLRHNTPLMVTEGRWTPKTYNEVIADCKKRNDRIVEEAVAYARRGHGVLIDVARVPHSRYLWGRLSDALSTGKVGVLTGTSSRKERTDVLRNFQDGGIRIVVSTVMGEGVDIAAIECVFNAEGGKADSAVEQRLRCLTPAPGKTMAHFNDLVDDHHKFTKEWTLARFRLYRKHKAFKFWFEPKGGS